MFSSPFSPPTPPDRSLTPANILSATEGIPLWTSADSYLCLGMPLELHDEIAGSYDGEVAKNKLLTKWIASHPCPTWEKVVWLLRALEKQGRGRVGAAKEAEEK